MSMLRSYDSRVAEAIRFKNAGDFWFEIGRTTPWTDDTSPPTPDRSASGADEVIGYKKITTLELVYPDATGTITYNGVVYKISSEANAYTNDARYVYLSGQLINSTFPVQTFRQIALRSGCLPDQDIILPGALTDAGAFEGLDNRAPIVRTSSTTETISYIFRF